MDKQFTLGGINWQVITQDRTDVHGICEPDLLRIILSSRMSNQQHKDLVFYHELTHAILNVMGNDLYSNEEFVNTFSTLLHQAISTLKDNKE